MSRIFALLFCHISYDQNKTVKLVLQFWASRGQLAKQLEKTNETFCFPTAILPQISFYRPTPQKKHVGSQEVIEVYRAAKWTRLVNLNSRVSDDFQLTVKQWDLISQQKNVFMLVRSVKKTTMETSSEDRSVAKQHVWAVI